MAVPTFEDLRSGGMERVMDHVAEDQGCTAAQIVIAKRLLKTCGPLQTALDNFVSHPRVPHDATTTVAKDWEAAADLLASALARVGILLQANPGEVEHYHADTISGERSRRVFK